MADDRWDRIEQLFDDALDLDADRIPDWLAQLDDDVRPDLERLLRAHRAAGEFLEAPAAAAAAELVSEAGDAKTAGLAIGPYRIVHEIGRGGMGAVYLAHRDDLDLDVAIKRLPHSVVSSRTVRAFLAERRTLARLEHPHIARLLDAGLTDDGAPYFAMERIDGESITRFSDTNRLTVGARLRLFLDVCHAVEYAHGRLVVHRDLKPSNIFVTRDGAPKLLDFGIAKVLDDGAPHVSTQTLRQFMTPQYAAPEQIRGEEIGTTSDVYSLGAVLYELLAGHPPYDVETGTPFEVGRTILETEPPPLAEAIPADDEHDIATHRATTPRRLRQQLSGDLTTIVAQAMHKDRNRRYTSVAALADDIARHLDGRPVLARGDSLAYRTERFVRRKWLPLTLTAMALSAAVGFGVFHTRQVAAERDRAQREAQTADAVSDFLISVFLASDPDQFGGKEPTAQDLLVRGTERVKNELQDEPLVRARLLDVLGEVQRKRGHFQDAQPLLEESLALRRELFGDRDAEVIQSLVHLSSLHGDLMEWDEATALAQEAYDLSAKIYGSQHPEAIYRLHNLGICLSESGRREEAEPILRRSLEGRRRLLGEEHTAVAHAIGTLANLMRDLGRYEEARDLYAEALEVSRKIYGDDHVRVASVWNNLGRMHSRLLEYDEAERCCAEALRIRRIVYGENSPRLIPSIGTLASIRFDRGDYAAAEADYVTTLALSEAAHGPDYEDNVGLLTALAAAREGMSHFADAESTFVQALGVAERSVGTKHAEWARAAERFGGFLCRRDRPEEALRWILRALDVQLETYEGAENERVRATRIALAAAYRQLGRLDEARQELTKADAGIDPVDSDSVYERANWALTSARLERDEDHQDAARARYVEALDALTQFLPPVHPRIVEVREELESLGGS